jgi:hypothetical protein
LLRSVLAAVLVVACGGKASPRPAGDAGKPPAKPVPCDDGTGRKDCCPVTLASGEACDFGPDTCWTKCNRGFTSQASCSGGTWILGHGLFPCGSDAGAPAAPSDAGQPCTDANIQMIQASDYDQTCANDSDCIAVGEGNACYPCVVQCPTAAISASAKKQYDAAIAKTTGAKQAGTTTCHCPAGFTPCCIGGKCHADSQCSSR